ncbi:hypothetical protein [Variovorax paradoxus]|uniref:hypothetical protein n=1 Tax=Variovorax paradoxus TaxID=34073 RepID=UPI0012931701|nr:hypothetical protein [Variovorax paradoxus]
MKGRAVALLSLILTARPVAACSYIVQTQISFEPGSAELNRSQVIHHSRNG